MKYAPILIPTLCRAEKFKKCLESLRKNEWSKYTEIFIALDYPLKDCHWPGYREICNYLEQDFPEFSALNVIRREHNYGVSKNSSDAQDIIFQRFDRLIYTDDDTEFSPNFIEYIDRALDYYEHAPDVIAVCGYSYPLQWDVSEASTLFKTTTGLFMWGTGFWREKYIPIRKELSEGLLRKEYATGNKNKWRKKLTDARYLDFLGLGTSEEKCLLDDATDVGLSTYMQLYDKYAIIPVLSKVRNHGFDGSGVYCQKIEDSSFDALSFDYSHQTIDSQAHFDVRSDTLNHDEENRKKWNKFDCRNGIRRSIFWRKSKIYLRRMIGKEKYTKIKFVIVSTRQRWGGAIALHALCYNLEILGYDASIYYINDGESYHRLTFWIKHSLFRIKDSYKNFCVKLKGEAAYRGDIGFSGYVDVAIEHCHKKILPFVTSNTVVIYPDVVYGNFLHAKNVVRWLLYYNRYNDDAYGEDDLFYAYRDVFNDRKKNPENRVLQIAYFNFDLYKQTNFGLRKGNCYVIRKGKNRLDLPKEFDGPVIDGLSEKEKVKTFNLCERCISYDTQTAYSEIAAICGCISIVIPEEGKNWTDYRSTEEERYGVAFGQNNEEIDWALNTVDMLKEKLEAYNTKGLKEAEKFAKDIAAHFGLDG